MVFMGFIFYDVCRIGIRCESWGLFLQIALPCRMVVGVPIAPRNKAWFLGKVSADIMEEGGG